MTWEEAMEELQDKLSPEVGFSLDVTQWIHAPDREAGHRTPAECQVYVSDGVGEGRFYRGQNLATVIAATIAGEFSRDALPGDSTPRPLEVEAFSEPFQTLAKAEMQEREADVRREEEHTGRSILDVDDMPF